MTQRDTKAARAEFARQRKAWLVFDKHCRECDHCREECWGDYCPTGKRLKRAADKKNPFVWSGLRFRYVVAVAEYQAGDWNILHDLGPPERWLALYGEDESAFEMDDPLWRREPVAALEAKLKQLVRETNATLAELKRFK